MSAAAGSPPPEAPRDASPHAPRDAPPGPRPLARLHVAGAPLAPLAEIDLPEATSRHAMVRRVQPGHTLRLFDGSGAEWPAEVLAVTRHSVRVRLAAVAAAPATGELPAAVTLAFCMPANERVDALVEKATELGAATLQPLMSERSVLRLSGERAERRRAHWQAVAVAACEQCGRARVPDVLAVRDLATWLREPAHTGALRWLLSTDHDAAPWSTAASALSLGAGSLEAAGEPGAQAAPRPIVLLSGPEGGFTPAEEQAARAAGFIALTLGPRILRADTAPLAALAWLALSHPGAGALASR